MPEPKYSEYKFVDPPSGSQYEGYTFAPSPEGVSPVPTPKPEPPPPSKEPSSLERMQNAHSVAGDLSSSLRILAWNGVRHNLPEIGSIAAAALVPEARGFSLGRLALTRILAAGFGGAAGKSADQTLDSLEGKGGKTPGQMIDEQSAEFIRQATNQATGEAGIGLAHKAVGATIRFGERWAADTAAYKHDIRVKRVADALNKAHEIEGTQKALESVITDLRGIKSPSLSVEELKGILKETDFKLLGYARRPYDDLIAMLQTLKSNGIQTNDVFLDATKLGDAWNKMVARFPSAEGGIAKPWTQIPAKLQETREAIVAGSKATKAQLNNIADMLQAGGKIPKGVGYKYEEKKVEFLKVAEMIQQGKIDLDLIKEATDDPEVEQQIISMVIDKVAHNKNLRLSEAIEMAGSLSQYAWKIQSEPGGDRIRRMLTQDNGKDRAPLNMLQDMIKKTVRDKYGSAAESMLSEGLNRWGKIADIRKQAWYQAIFPDSVTGQSQAADHVWTLIEPNNARMVNDLKDVIKIGSAVVDKRGVTDVAASALKEAQAMGIIRAQFLNGLLYQKPLANAGAPSAQAVPDLVNFSKRVKEYGKVVDSLFDTPVLKSKLNQIMDMSDEVTALSAQLSRDLTASGVKTRHFLSNLETNITAMEGESARLSSAGTQQGQTTSSYAGRQLGSRLGLAATLGAVGGGFAGGGVGMGLGAIGMTGGVLLANDYLLTRLPLAIMRGADDPRLAGVIRTFVEATKAQNLGKATAAYRSLLLLQDMADTGEEPKSNVKKLMSAKTNIIDWSGVSLSSFIRSSQSDTSEKQREDTKKAIEKKLGPPPKPTPLASPY